MHNVLNLDADALQQQRTMLGAAPVREDQTKAPVVCCLAKMIIVATEASWSHPTLYPQWWCSGVEAALKAKSHTHIKTNIV